MTVPFSEFRRARAVIFDFDGVIADTEWLHSDTFRKVLEEEGIRITPEDHDRRFLGINDRAGFALAFEDAGRALESGEVVRLVERKSVYYGARIEEIRPFPGAAELVRALAARGPLAIASGGRRHEIEAILIANGLRRDFRAILSADDVARSKPDPEGMLLAFEALRAEESGRWSDLEPAECLVIEDSLPGIDAAHAAGMRCVAVAHTYPRERLGGADRVVERIADLRAEEVIERKR